MSESGYLHFFEISRQNSPFFAKGRHKPAYAYIASALYDYYLAASA